MGVRVRIAMIGSIVVALCLVALAADDFTWNWRNQEVIGRTDPSLSNTSKLTEPERAALLDAVVLRLQKPMSERGYDDDRIREIAGTTRLHFLDLGEGKPAIMATPLGLEGGCDELVNCPFWIFRHTEDGYVSLLDSVAASYTVQPTSTDGYSDLVLSRHVTARESKLVLYKFGDNKYADAGCYIATWPEPKEGGLQDPDVKPCASGEAK